MPDIEQRTGAHLAGAAGTIAILLSAIANLGAWIFGIDMGIIAQIVVVAVGAFIGVQLARAE